MIVDLSERSRELSESTSTESAVSVTDLSLRILQRLIFDLCLLSQMIALSEGSPEGSSASLPGISVE